MVRHINLKYENVLYAEIPVSHFVGKSSCACKVRALISLKSAGDMNRNRDSFLKKLNIKKENVIALRQIHSKKVYFAHEVQSKCSGRIAGDGLISMENDKVLSVTVADCLPILLFNRKNCCYSLLHSGWRGTGIVTEAVYRMKRECGSLPADISVVIGPGIGVCCYEVSRDVCEYFKNTFGSASVVQRKGSCFVDLREANISLLKNIGVEDITVVDDCTSCNVNLQSYRRDGKENFGTMIVLFGKL
ncbi:MAG: peptidoglycan editing factor PgeF [Spirochaetes bacterium]|nr:MAG: peptidoglycan editing factor PgeF [Spirochaetota bacterium]